MRPHPAEKHCMQCSTLRVARARPPCQDVLAIDAHHEGAAHRAASATLERHCVWRTALSVLVASGHVSRVGAWYTARGPTVSRCALLARPLGAHCAQDDPPTRRAQASATCCEPAEAADEAGATAGGVVAISVVPRGRLVKLKDERPRTLRSSTSRVRKPLRTRANAPAVARAAPALKKVRTSARRARRFVGARAHSSAPPSCAAQGSNGAERKKPKRVAFQKEE